MGLNLSNVIVKSDAKKPKNIIYDKDWNVSFDIVFLSKVEFQALMGKHTKIAFDPRTHTHGNEKLDIDKLNEEIVKTCVKGWHGITYEWVQTLIVIDASQITNLKEELSFNEDNLMALFKHAFGLDNWLIDTIRNASNFAEVEKEAERKN